MVWVWHEEWALRTSECKENHQQESFFFSEIYKWQKFLPQWKWNKFSIDEFEHSYIHIQIYVWSFIDDSDVQQPPSLKTFKVDILNENSLNIEWERHNIEYDFI